MTLAKAELQKLRSLRYKKGREALGLFVIEGEKVITELLAAEFPLEDIYATARWSGPRSRELSEGEMAQISLLPTPSSVLALARLHRPRLLAGALCQGLSLLLDRIQDPGNVGTLLRIADWYGCDRVILSPDCADLFSPKVINASKASFARVAVYTSPLAPLLAVGNCAIPVWGCDLKGESLHTLSGMPPQNLALIIGSEGQGLSPELEPYLTQRVTIPRCGQAESLNAAIAAAIICDKLRHWQSTAKQ